MSNLSSNTCPYCGERLIIISSLNYSQCFNSKCEKGKINAALKISELGNKLDILTENKFSLVFESFNLNDEKVKAGKTTKITLVFLFITGLFSRAFILHLINRDYIKSFGDYTIGIISLIVLIGSLFLLIENIKEIMKINSKIRGNEKMELDLDKEIKDLEFLKNFYFENNLLF